MVDQIGVVQQLSRSGTGTQSYTSPDITETPRVLIVMWGNSSTESADETARFGMAIVSLDATTDPTRGGACSTLIRNAQATPAGALGQGNQDVILLPTDGGAGFDIVAVLDSVIAGGVSLNFTTAAVQIDITMVILAGDAMRSWGGVASSASTTPQQVDTGPGGDLFPPDLLLVLTTVTSLDAANRTTIPQFGFGGVTATAQKCTHSNWRAGVEPSEVDGTVLSNRGNAAFIGVGRTPAAHTFVLNATGFTFAGVNTADIRSRFVAIKFGGRFRVGVVNEAISGSTGLQLFQALGFGPSLVVGISSLMTAEDTQVQDETASALGIFITGTKVSRAATIREEEGHTGVSVATGRQEDVALLTYDHLGAVAQRATWAGTAPGGFRFDFSTATAGLMSLVGIELAPSSPIGGQAPAHPGAREPGRARRVITAGVLRASRYGRMLRAVFENRRKQRARRQREVEPAPVIERVTTDPALVAGDNAFPGSRKGADAGAGSVAGDSA